MSTKNSNAISLSDQLCKSIKTFETLAINRECRDKLYQYNDALMQSLYSILDDPDCGAEDKLGYLNTSLDQYVAAMKKIFPTLIGMAEEHPREIPATANPIGKSHSERFDIIQEVKKYNHRHDPKSGRFAPKNGGGGGAGARAFGEATPKNFTKAVTAARESCPEEIRWRVTAHTEKELKNDYPGAKLHITSPGGSTVAVTADGDIISVCKKVGDKTRGSELLKMATENGGTKLDSFSGNHLFYTKCGFEPVSWTPFNEQYAPDGWRKGIDKPEPIIFYKYTGKEVHIKLDEFLSNTKPFEGEDGYDKAMKARNDALEGKK
jgi:hypothetical protein